MEAAREWGRGGSPCSGGTESKFYNEKTLESDGGDGHTAL